MKCSCLKMRIRRPMRWCAIWNSAHINGSGRRFVSTKQVWSIGMRANTKKTVIRCSRKQLKRSALWLAAAAVTGLRPCEWRTAQLNEDATQLIVQNAKATNGRANGASRTIAIRPEDAASIQAHLASIHELLARGYPFAHIHQCCSIALNRACKALWGTDPAKRYALYSARHQFAANAKATTSQQEVARLIGHHSIRTARRHYAPRRSAWLKFRQADDMAPKHER